MRGNECSGIWINEVGYLKGGKAVQQHAKTE